MQRPTSVTVAAWVIMALAAEAVVGSYSSMLRPIFSQLADPRVGVPVTALLGSLIQIAILVSAVFMLRGASWARIAYTGLAGFVVLGLLVSWSHVSGMALIAAYAIVRTAVLLYVLFRPEANAYFSGSVGSINSDGILPIGRTDAFEVATDSNRTSPS